VDEGFVFIDQRAEGVGITQDDNALPLIADRPAAHAEFVEAVVNDAIAEGLLG
jgi:hypothetical protein